VNQLKIDRSFVLHMHHDPNDAIIVRSAIARTTAQTGVEMEAMVAAAIAALTIYDMTKGIEKGITIESVRLPSVLPLPLSCSCCWGVKPSRLSDPTSR